MMAAAPETPTRRRGRPRGFDCREALARAGETFRRLGYEGASIADLTQAMGITPQSLYSAFSSKAELYRAALAQHMETGGAFAWRALAEERTTLAAFTRLFAEAAREYCAPGQPRGCMVASGVLACAEENREVADHVAALRAEFRERLEARLARGLRDGDLRAQTDIAPLASFLQAVLQGMSLQAMDGADEAELRATGEVALTALRRCAAEAS
jgi:AcrR family transcriptional regulator